MNIDINVHTIYEGIYIETNSMRNSKMAEWFSYELSLGWYIGIITKIITTPILYCVNDVAYIPRIMHLYNDVSGGACRTL